MKSHSLPKENMPYPADCSDYDFICFPSNCKNGFPRARDGFCLGVSATVIAPPKHHPRGVLY